MTQQTLVFKLPSSRHDGLRSQLAQENFEFRVVPHAVFSARRDGIIATLYKSGKLVVQGSDADWFAGRFLDSEPLPAKGSSSSSSPSPPSDVIDRVMIGSDECGKGDYFGPLIACAVRLTPEEAEQLSRGKIADSKTLTDRTALELGGALRDHVTFAIAQLDPPEYNDAWEKCRNVNEVLADLHAQVIRELYVPGVHVLVDRFARESVVASRLTELDITLEQRPRAESNLAVAAASVIAREQFLLSMSKLSDESAIDLRKGAGTPVDEAGVGFAELHGFEKLRTVAKMHFKNTTKIEDALR